MPPSPEDPQGFVRANLRRNFLALGADFALFLVGLSFASQTTILPAFAVHLGASNVVIGAIPAVMTVGWLLPSLFAAGHTATLTHRLPFVLRYTIWERLPFLALVGTAFWLAERAPSAALATLLLTLVAITVVGGILMPAWMDVVGRTIPTEVRGRFFALWSTLASIGGAAGSFATAHILATLAPPASYGVCFLVTALFMGLSYLALRATREPAVPAASAPTTLVAYLRRIPDLLGRDRNFSWFLRARWCIVLGGMAAAFYTVYGLKVHGAPVWRVGLFTTVLYAGQIAGNTAFGWIADRAGHRLVIVIGASAMVLANVVALGAPTLDAFTTVFVLVGLHQAAVNVSNLTVLLEFAPTPEERPTYVGLGNTAVAPVAFGAPLIGGLVADALGFPVVFALAGACGTAGVTLLTALVREPRRARG